MLDPTLGFDYTKTMSLLADLALVPDDDHIIITPKGLRELLETLIRFANALDIRPLPSAGDGH